MRKDRVTVTKVGKVVEINQELFDAFDSIKKDCDLKWIEWIERHKILVDGESVGKYLENRLITKGY